MPIAAKPKPLKLSDPLSSLPGVGVKTAQALAGRGVTTLRELVFYLPRRYEDYSVITQISHLRPGPVTVKATLKQVVSRRARRWLSVTEAIASDRSGSLRVVWFNQPYRKSSIKADQEYYLSGGFKLSNRQFSLINPVIEAVSSLPLNSARIVPIYPESKALSSWVLRRAVASVLPLVGQIHDYDPRWLLERLELLPLAPALGQIHFPDSQSSLEQARRRFQFDELFPIMLANELNRRQRQLEQALKVPFKPALAKEFVSKLPFKLTDDQRKVIWRIYQDMEAELPMNRLVEGDVGSGKTVVAAMAAVMALSEGFKVAFMAPTELLANQHAATIEALLTPLGLSDQLVLLTGSLKSKSKQAAIERANRARGSFVIGTHSLLTSGVDWHNLALVIIDEQHRFGVDQRQQLQKSAGHLPHFLSTTATPIPRSLALTLFNDLDLSRLMQMPAGRRPIKSRLITPSDRPHFDLELRSQLKRGRQAYIVCPYIHPENGRDQTAAETIFKDYQRRFPGYSVGLLHAQLKADEQNRLMKDFVSGKISILVATTVIEVGVDVANASVMAIYGPERFGLAQLHQLRGRVGRGRYDSFCYLLLSDSLEPASRLRQFVSTGDGFRLSELDLKLRGPGAVYGKLQHGKGVFNLLTLNDSALIDSVKDGVSSFIASHEDVRSYPELARRVKLAQQLTYLN